MNPAPRPAADRMRRAAFAATCLVVLLVLGIANAHATVVFGTLTVQPNPPPSEAPLVFELTIDDPTGAPVEDAIVLAELTPDTSEATEGASVSAEEPLVATRFEEREPGTYRAELRVPDQGTYRILLRDQTFRQEEATQIVSMAIGTGAEVDPIDFLFPPTATGGGLSTWLLWLVAIPLLAGIVVTVLVLRSGADPATQPDAGGERGTHAKTSDERR